MKKNKRRCTDSKTPMPDFIATNVNVNLLIAQVSGTDRHAHGALAGQTRAKKDVSVARLLGPSMIGMRMTTLRRDILALPIVTCQLCCLSVQSQVRTVMATAHLRQVVVAPKVIPNARVCKCPQMPANARKCSNAQMHNCSNAQVLECTNAQIMYNCSKTQVLKCTNGQIHNYSIAQMRKNL